MFLTGLPKEIDNDDDPMFVSIKKPMLGEIYLRSASNGKVEETETDSDSDHETPKYDINKYLSFDDPTVDVASENELDEEHKHMSTTQINVNTYFTQQTVDLGTIIEEDEPTYRPHIEHTEYMRQYPSSFEKSEGENNDGDLTDAEISDREKEEMERKGK